jgi:D-serine deaminase-like pyridoxal phosphate-dependent protein
MPIGTPIDLKPELGTPVSELETPTLVVDLDVMGRNIASYVEFAERNDCRLRSHVKTHKIPDIAKLQHERSGGGGIVCQTLGEAGVMAYNGLDDIYLSYMVVGERKLRHAVHLAEKLDRFAVTVDHPDHVHMLEAAAGDRHAIVGVIVEIDVGLGRTGVEPGEPAAALATLINEQPHLRFDGLLAYEAHVKSEAETEADFRRLCHEAMDQAARTVDEIEGAGVAVEEVKVGGTATSAYSGTHEVVTEINPGMYPFNDVGELEHRPWAVSKEDCAATIFTDVISVPDDDQLVVDAGSKTLSLDKPQMPVPKRCDGIEYANASEEHGWIDTSASEVSFEIGDRLEFIVPHVCTTINLHDTLVGVRNGAVEEVWNVRARGAVK